MTDTHLRITPALTAIAAAMYGTEPSPADLADLAVTRVDAATLHAAAAVALRRAMRPHLLSRSTGTADYAGLVDAYRLAAELAGGGPADLLPDRLGAATAVATLQNRFLERVCAQVEFAAATPKLSVPPRSPAQRIAARNGEIAAGMVLLADHSGSDRHWLHATSTISVGGTVERVVVDAGPPGSCVDVAARVAAPLTVTPAGGFWPVTVVADCLRLCAPAVRRWVAAMSRELHGPGNRDIQLWAATSLRDFLVSPATAALTGNCGGQSTLPVRALNTGYKAAPSLLHRMRTGTLPNGQLRFDSSVPAHTRLPHLRSDESALLAALPPLDLRREVEVTVNFTVPGWVDTAGLLAQVKAAGGFTLTEAVPAWADRDVVAGPRHRLSVRVRARRGLTCRTRHGLAVMLPAGAVFGLVAATSRDGHAVLYGKQLDAAEPAAERAFTGRVQAHSELGGLAAA